jgi:predicted murein hydrolase (TIGR00659 family)
MSTILSSNVWCMTLTIATYTFCLQLFQRFKTSWLNPLYTSTILTISILLLFNIPLTTYQSGNFIFEQLLQLSVVSFAVPLFKQWPLLKRNIKKICCGVLCGSAFGLISVFLLSQLFHFSQAVLASLIPRAVTMPIALTVSNNLGGITSITVFVVLFSGLFSVIFGPILLERVGIKSKAARGLAMGTSAQMLGANRSLIWGEEEGALGCIGMASSAIMLSFSIPLLLILL